MKKLIASPKQRIPATVWSRIFCPCVPSEFQTYEDKWRQRLLWNMFGAKREEVTGEWKTLHQILYGLLDQKK
jgi:hypothetical protein